MPEPRAARLASVLARLGLLAGCVVAAARKLGDFDLPWHLATGRLLLLHRSIPATDDLSYTFRGAPLRGEYLSDLVFAFAERSGGAIGLHVLGLVLLTALAILLVERAGRGATLAGAALAALALSAAGPWLVIRPALLSLVLLAAALLILDGHRARPRLSRLLPLVPLQLAWGNAHGLAALGAVIAVGHGVYRVACRLARGRLGSLLPVEEGAGAGGALAVTLAAAAATCASSYGVAIFANPLLLRGYAGSITEWTPTSLSFVLQHDPVALLLGVGAVLALLAPLVARRELPLRSRLPSLFDLALVAGALALGISAVRLLAVLAVVVAPMLARVLGERLGRLRLGPLLAVVCGLSAPVALLGGPGPRPGLGWDEENLPVGAVEWAGQRGLAGPVWNFLPFGGWLEWQLHPSVRAFIDGRTGWLYPPDFVASYFAAQRDPAAFAALQQKWGFTWALVRARRGERFDVPISSDPAWRMAFLDESAAIYVKAGTPDEPRAGDTYRLLRHDDPVAWLLADPRQLRALDGTTREALAHDARLAVRQAPTSRRAHALAVLVEAATGDCPRADSHAAWLAKGGDADGLATLARAALEATCR